MTKSSIESANTITALARMAGARSGSSTRRSARTGDAPRSIAASSYSLPIDSRRARPAVEGEQDRDGHGGQRPGQVQGREQDQQPRPAPRIAEPGAERAAAAAFGGPGSVGRRGRVPDRGRAGHPAFSLAALAVAY